MSTPLAILVEHKHLSDEHKQEMKSILETNGYDIRDCGGDYFAKHSRQEVARGAESVGLDPRTFDLPGSAG